MSRKRVCTRCLLEEDQPRVKRCPHIHVGCLRVLKRKEKRQRKAKAQQVKS
jgi:hypothetical protein